MEKSKLLISVAHELLFWKEFVKSDRFINQWVNNNIITPELDKEVANFILDHYNIYGINLDYRILDIGSGAVSILNGLVPNNIIYAADPLGALYATIFDYKLYGIKVPDTIFGEELNDVNIYDIVHMRNAIDHSQDPLLVFHNLIRATKKDGFIIIQGFENEAIYENWQGFHQFNFTQNIDGSIEYSDILGITFKLDYPVFKHTKIKELYKDKDWFISIYKKV